jgi:hypothetical protein
MYNFKNNTIKKKNKECLTPKTVKTLEMKKMQIRLHQKKVQKENVYSYSG